MNSCSAFHLLYLKNSTIICPLIHLKQKSGNSSTSQVFHIQSLNSIDYTTWISLECPIPLSENLIIIFPLHLLVTSEIFSHVSQSFLPWAHSPLLHLISCHLDLQLPPDLSLHSDQITPGPHHALNPSVFTLCHNPALSYTSLTHIIFIHDSDILTILSLVLETLPPTLSLDHPQLWICPFISFLLLQNYWG